MKKILSIILTLALAISITIVAFASSYSSYYSFDTTLRGTTRYYDGSNITFKTTGAYTDPNPQPIQYPTIFSVSLYRDRSFPFADDKIGTSTFNRTGNDIATWTNVGPGNYYFYLSKAFDTVYLYCDNVDMYN